VPEEWGNGDIDYIPKKGDLLTMRISLQNYIIDIIMS